MQKGENLFIFAAITCDGGSFHPRFANEQEQRDWQGGPTMYTYANQLGEKGREQLNCHPIVFTQSSWRLSSKAHHLSSHLCAIELVFKRSKEEDDFHC